MLTKTHQTAGVLSAAVQQPGSGSELLSTPQRSSSNRDVGYSEATPPSQPHGSSSAETSGGYTDISDSDVRSGDDTGTGAGEEHEGDYPLDEEYEDEEDRLIAQGGMGIPLDEVSQTVDVSHHKLLNGGRSTVILHHYYRSWTRCTLGENAWF